MMERAGVHTKQRSHIFRKTLNTNLARQHVMEHILDALLGWTSTTVRTKHYTGVASDEVREALLKAYTNDPVVPDQMGGYETQRSICSCTPALLPPKETDALPTKVITSFNAVQPAPVQVSQSNLRWSLLLNGADVTDRNANSNSSGGFHTKLP